MIQVKLSPIAYVFSAVAALLMAGVSVAGVDAMAATPGFYRAELVAPASDAKFVAKDVAWSCNDTSCTAPRGTSRPAVVCSALVRKVGPVASFTADNKALDADALAKCNAAAD